jgi:hypothetical protein
MLPMGTRRYPWVGIIFTVGTRGYISILVAPDNEINRKVWKVT